MASTKWPKIWYVLSFWPEKLKGVYALETYQFSAGLREMRLIWATEIHKLLWEFLKEFKIQKRPVVDTQSHNPNASDLGFTREDGNVTQKQYIPKQERKQNTP